MQISSSIGSTRISKAMAIQHPFFGPGPTLRFWAENGLVKCEDSREDLPPHKRYTTMSWHEAAYRAIGISDMIIESSEDRRWGFERQRLQQFLQDMEAVIREAKEQGGPLDGVSSIRAAQRAKPVSVLVPQFVEM